MEKTSEVPEEDVEHPAPVSRRSFLLGVGVCLATAAGAGMASLRFISPSVAFEPPIRFKLGLPEEYDDGTVTFDEEHRIFVARQGNTFYAMSATCTHLGCTTRWEEEDGVIFCPCHGSKFTREGKNFAGPAPRPLERLGIAMTEDGRLEVDKDQRFPPERWRESLIEV